MAKSSSSGETKQPVIIALVFFVLTTLILGVLAYVFSDGKNVALQQVKDAEAKTAAAESVAKKAKATLNMYKVMVGSVDENSPDWKDLQAATLTDLEPEFQSAKQALVGRLRESIQNTKLTGQNIPKPETYLKWDLNNQGTWKESMVKSMVQVYADRITSEGEAQLAKKDYNDNARFMKSKSEELEKSQQEYQKQLSDIPNKVARATEAERTKFNDYTKQYEADKGDSRTAVATAETARDQANKDKKRTDELNASLRNNNDRMREQLDAIVDPLQFDRPHGKIIRRENDNLVDIDLGFTDNVRPGLTFAVFPFDTATRGMQSRSRSTGERDQNGNLIVRPVPKGRIEVIEVLGPKLSQCRIIDEESPVRDRVLSNDLIYNAIWRKGQPDHVVLFGIFDLDGDGRDDISQLIRDLRRVGVEVDGYYSFEKQKWEGDFTAQTVFAVQGWSPSVGGLEGNKEAKIRILNLMAEARKQAKERGVRVLLPRDFFPRIGYKARADVPQDAINQAATAYTRALLADPAAAPMGGNNPPPAEKKDN